MIRCECLRLTYTRTQHGRTTHTARSQHVSYERNSNLTRTTIVAITGCCL